MDVQEVFNSLGAYGWQYCVYTGELRAYEDGKCFCPITAACLVITGKEYPIEEWVSAAQYMGFGYYKAKRIADLADLPEERKDDYMDIWEDLAEACQVDMDQGEIWANMTNGIPA